MKVITVWEPWASLIKEGVKRVETRSWATKYRGGLYIHAGKKILTRQNVIEYREMLELLADTDFRYGRIVAKCRLTDCRIMDEALIGEVRKNHSEYISGFYSVGRYAWMLADIEPLTSPIPARGRLGLWEYNQMKNSQKE